MINSLNPRSHLSQLLTMGLLSQSLSTKPTCQRAKKSSKEKRKRLQEKLARRKQR